MKAAGLLLVLAGCAGTTAPEEEALVRYDQAEALLAQGRYGEAEPHYAFCVSARERWKEAHYRLAYCRERAGNESGAVSALERFLRIHPGDPATLRELARLYTHRGQVAPAIAALKALKEPTPGDVGEIQRLEGLKNP